MSFLDAKAHIVRCNKCGTERQSYNDPRTSTSVIECKKCFESHRLWTHVRCVEPETTKESAKAPRPSNSLSSSTSSASPAVALQEQQQEGSQRERNTSNEEGVREDPQHPPYSNPLSPKPKGGASSAPTATSTTEGGATHGKKGKAANSSENTGGDGCGCVLQ